jgi:chromosome segregation ATPase
MQKMEDYVETLREALEKENATEDGRVDALRAAFKEAEEDKEVQEGSYHDSVQAMNDMVQSLKEIRRELAAKDQSITELVERSHVASSEQSLVASKRRELFNDKNIAVADIERQKDKRDEIQESLEHAEARVLEWCGKAEQVSPRVAIDEGETTLSLDHKLSKLNRDLDRYAQQYVLCSTLLLLCEFDFVLTYSRLGGSRDEIAAEAGRAETAYLRAKDQVEELSTVSQVSSIFQFSNYHFACNSANIKQLFKVTLHNRKKRWEIFRAHISSRAKAQFTYLLSERSFRGQLLTDHTNKILDLQVSYITYTLMLQSYTYRL